jgi:predicted nucleic acid-binding protein
MYIVGASHPNKVAALRILEKAIMDRQRLVTDAEVFQEILHRCVSINRRQVIQPAFDALHSLVDSVLAVDHEAVVEAKQIALGYPQLSAGDAGHLAVMRLHGIDRILSFNSGFDGFQGITRIY